MTQQKAQVLVFDWGGTLMTEFSQFNGPMIEWPMLAAEPGAVDALAALQKQYRLVVATNAANSTAQQVRQALDRVGLGDRIENVFTRAEVNGAKKPALAFFEAISNALNVPPSALTMIGDSLPADMLGAARAGWHTVWYNPLALPAPGLMPLHQAELYHFANLPDLLKEDLSLPSIGLCFSWLAEFNASAQLLCHVQLVAAAAYQLALWLVEQAIAVNPVWAHRGGLLHDLCKLTQPGSIAAGRNDHGAAAAEVLNQRGQPVLAEIARRHMLFCILDDRRKPATWEEKLVFYADKLIEGGQVVSLDTRLQALRLRYARDVDRIAASTPALYELEAEICTCLNRTPEELLLQLNSALYGRD